MKLQIKNNNITLSEEIKEEIDQSRDSLNEDATETFGNLVGASGVKGIFKATKDVVKFIKDTTLTIYKVFGSLVKNIWSKNGSMEDFAKRVKDIEKHFVEETNRAMQGLDNTTRQMIQEAGLDEKNIDTILAAGLPIVSIVNAIQSKPYSSKITDNPTYVEGKKALDVILTNIVNIYVGEEIPKEKITFKADVANVIKAEITKIMGEKFAAWIESIDDNSKLSSSDKTIIDSIANKSRIENLKTLKGDNKKAEEIGNIIKNAYISATGVKESKFLLRISNNKINQEVLLEKRAELPKALAVTSLDKLLKAVAFSLVFRENIIKSVFNNLSKLSLNLYNTIYSDLSTFAQFILVYKSLKEVVKARKDSVDQFEEDDFKKTLESKMESIKSFLHSNAISAIKNYPEINFEQDNKKLNFVLFCQTVLKIYKDQFETPGIDKVAGKYYNQLGKYIMSIIKSKDISDEKMNEKDSAKNIDNNVIKLYNYLDEEKDSLNAKKDIEEIKSVIDSIEQNLEQDKSETEGTPEQTPSDSSSSGESTSSSST